jgi:serine/tyrosine/threonine adenylyltransferase
MHASPLALDALAFDNRFTTELPADPVENGPRRQVRGALFSRVVPTPTAAPVTLSRRGSRHRRRHRDH